MCCFAAARELSYFDPDVARVVAMLQRRCKLLEPLAAELNPQYYLDLV